MRPPFVMSIVFACAVLLASGCSPASSDPLPLRAVHVRGTVQSVTGRMLTVATVSGPMCVQLVPPFQVSKVVASDRGHLKDGSYIGVTSVTLADGSLRAIEIHIFPKGACRTGEENYAWDLSPLGGGCAKMTRGTTSHAKSVSAPTPNPGLSGEADATSRTTRALEGKQGGGSSLTLQFKSSSMTSPQALTIPWGVPIVTFVPGGTWDLKPGAHVLVIATQKPNGELTVARVLVGKNELVPSI